jgi:hypothetical protein
MAWAKNLHTAVNELRQVAEQAHARKRFEFADEVTSVAHDLLRLMHKSTSEELESIAPLKPAIGQWVMPKDTRTGIPYHVEQQAGDTWLLLPSGPRVQRSCRPLRRTTEQLRTNWRLA